MIYFNSGLVLRKLPTPGRATCTLPAVWHGNGVRGGTALNVCLVYGGELVRNFPYESVIVVTLSPGVCVTFNHVSGFLLFHLKVSGKCLSHAKIIA